MSDYSKENMFNVQMIEELAARMVAVHESFPAERFIEMASEGLEPLELKARSAHIREALRANLPEEIEDAIALLVASMVADGDDGTGGVEGVRGFRHMPALDFVAAYGLEHPELSLDAIETMTLYFSAEFAIRPFIRRYPEVTMARMLEWAEAAIGDFGGWPARARGQGSPGQSSSRRLSRTPPRPSRSSICSTMTPR